MTRFEFRANFFEGRRIRLRFADRFYVIRVFRSASFFEKQLIRRNIGFGQLGELQLVFLFQTFREVGQRLGGFAETEFQLVRLIGQLAAPLAKHGFPLRELPALFPDG